MEPNSDRLVILDRDGVINVDSDRFIKHPDEWQAIPGSLEAVALLNQAGFRVVVATNQSGVGRGLFDMVTLNAIHEKMMDALSRVGGRIEAVFFCPHAQNAGCDCRKPAIGMFVEISQRYSMPLSSVPAIGDSLRDLEAARDAGARPILVLTGKGDRTFQNGNLPEGTLVFDDLMAAARAVVAEAGE
jgi:D-glycero-D-manno-heptose 1,7-bisphosphate phosphatase